MQEPWISFAHARVKLEWAREIIPHIDKDCRAFEQHYSAVNLSTVQEGDELSIGAEATPIPPRIALMAGDAIRNMRAALDYCWNGLERALPKKADGYMPNAQNRAGLEARIKQPQLKGLLEKFPQITAMVLDQIRMHEDFDNGGNKPLIILNKMANWEKHNMLLITARAVKGMDFTWGNGNRMVVNAVIGDGPLITIKGAGVVNATNASPMSAKVVFGQHDHVQGEAIPPLLSEMLFAVDQAITAFEQAFPQNRDAV